MQNIIVFISQKISPFFYNKIVDTLQSYPMIQITENIDEARIIIEKEKRDNIDNIKQMIDDTITELKTKPSELHIYPGELAITKKDKIKHFIQRNANIKQFNTAKQLNKQRIYNTRHR